MAGVVAGAFSLLLLSSTVLSETGGATAAPVAGLDNVACLACHDGRKTLEVKNATGKAHELLPVNPDTYGKGVHAKMQCVACHREIKDAVTPHQLESAGKPDCAGCHTELWEAAKKKQETAQKPRLAAVIENIEAYRQSFHAKPNKEDKSHVNATCEQCHDTHGFAVPPRDSQLRAQWHESVPALCAEKCHEDELKAYKASAHGQAIAKNHDPKSAVCTDCHTSHAIANTSYDQTRLDVTWRCGNCHEHEKKTYVATYHGRISALGYGNTAKCFDCHDNHRILKKDNPRSKINEKNLLKTCRQCHDARRPGMYDAPPGFVSFQPHGFSDYKRYPQIWVATQIMNQLLIGTFAFFWLHTLLWFYREYRERQKNKSVQHVKIEGLTDLPAQSGGKHFQRFSSTWRIAHLLFAVTLMILTLTGIPLFYPESPWAQPLMRFLGGPHVAGVIHRVNAAIFAGVFVWHLMYMAVGIARHWSTFRFFGPNSLVPNLQDMKDIYAMFRWFIGKGPRPVFDRWTYWEKFDYWAPFWGVTIIGFSGLMMWLPTTTAQYLPGWAFNVAAIFHSEEAFLAVVFLFTVHFFNNHFRPDKFPLELVMFTGTMTLDDLQRDHPLEYQRLVASGELEQHLVDPPSPAMTSASKMLGFTLITVGLTLLTLVTIGFFTSF
jgi:cytochrome b subunit of formate dehydrogenase